MGLALVIFNAMCDIGPPGMVVETAAFLTACNLTGLYPKGWQGCRYDQAIEAWAVAKSLKMARDISQAKPIGGRIPGRRSSLQRRGCTERLDFLRRRKAARPDPLTFPTHWRWGWGIDIGIGHPFAAVLLCHDVDRDWIHVVAELRVSDEIPDQHVKAMRKIEEDIFGRAMEIPVAWPHDAGTRDRTSGTPIKNVYAHWNLKMMPEAASLPGLKGVEGRSLEGSIAEIDAREHGQAWYVSQRCRHYLEERRLYHRKDGEIVPLRDDTLSAGRYAYMMRRYFKSRIDCGGGAVGTAAYSQWVRKQAAPGQQRFARGSANHPDGSFDLFGV
jgi:hypothetical protein